MNKDRTYMKTKRFEVIACPSCGREYLPAEIFIPKSFFGYPKDIVRDVYCRILDYEGTSVDLQETYTCDKCNTLFQIKAKVSFTVATTKLENPDEPYVTSLQKNNLFE